MKLYALTISHRHGDNHYASLTPEARELRESGRVAHTSTCDEMIEED